MALAPADTTATGIRDSAVRSAEMSPLSCASRCTPPMPPVANTRIALACAANMVAATVVEPGSPDETAAARLLRLIFATLGVVASCSNSVGVSPMRMAPSMTPMVAGVAPASRTICSSDNAVVTPSGCGRPCVTSVVSSATTGARTARACATSSANLYWCFTVVVRRRTTRASGPRHPHEWPLTAPRVPSLRRRSLP